MGRSERSECSIHDSGSIDRPSSDSNSGSGSKMMGAPTLRSVSRLTQISNEQPLTHDISSVPSSVSHVAISLYMISERSTNALARVPARPSAVAQNVWGSSAPGRADGGTSMENGNGRRIPDMLVWLGRRSLRGRVVAAMASRSLELDRRGPRVLSMGSACVVERNVCRCIVDVAALIFAGISGPSGGEDICTNTPSIYAIAEWRLHSGVVKPTCRDREPPWTRAVTRVQ